MPRLDVLSAPTTLHHPRPTAGLSVSRPTWFHVPLPRRASLAQFFPVLPEGSPIEPITRWLLESGGRHRLELRLAARGQHAGVWLGIAGVGATPRDAAHTGRRAGANLVDVLDAFDVGAVTADAPRLPGRSVGLRHTGASSRLQCVHGLSATRATLGDCGRKGAPLVLRLQFDLSRARPDLVAEAEHLRRVACHADGHEVRWFVRPTGEIGRADPPSRRAAHIRDEAAGLRIRMLVHGSRFPSPLRMRMLSDTIGEDMQARLRWARTGEPLGSSVNTLAFGVAMLEAKVEVEGDGVPF